MLSSKLLFQHSFSNLTGLPASNLCFYADSIIVQRSHSLVRAFASTVQRRSVRSRDGNFTDKRSGMQRALKPRRNDRPTRSQNSKLGRRDHEWDREAEQQAKWQEQERRARKEQSFAGHETEKDIGSLQEHAEKVEAKTEHRRKSAEATDSEVNNVDEMHYCGGCGAKFQSQFEDRAGFIPAKKLQGYQELKRQELDMRARRKAEREKRLKEKANRRAMRKEQRKGEADESGPAAAHSKGKTGKRERVAEREQRGGKRLIVSASLSLLLMAVLGSVVRGAAREGVG